MVASRMNDMPSLQREGARLDRSKLALSREARCSPAGAAAAMSYDIYGPTLHMEI